MKFDFITIGGSTRDISFFTNKGVLIKNPKNILSQELLAFEYGAKIKVDRFNYSYGGGAANTAVCLSNFAFDVACITSVGNDENGEMIRKNLKEKEVSVKLLQINEKEGSGTSFVLIAPGGERIIFSQRGANNSLSISQKERRAIAKSKNIYIASLAGSWLKNLDNIFSSILENEQNVFWNPGMTQLLGGYKKISKYIKKTTVLAMNKDEALQLLHSSGRLDARDEKRLNIANNLVKEIHHLGPKIAVITLGSKGVIVYDGDKIYRKKILKEKKRVDTTGIGDAFNSTFAAGYIKYNRNINKALDLALKNTASKVGHLGAQNGLIKMKR